MQIASASRQEGIKLLHSYSSPKRVSLSKKNYKLEVKFQRQMSTPENKKQIAVLTRNSKQNANVSKVENESNDDQ